jgi:hypothetical protein
LNSVYNVSYQRGVQLDTSAFLADFDTNTLTRLRQFPMIRTNSTTGMETRASYSVSECQGNRRQYHLVLCYIFKVFNDYGLRVFAWCSRFIIRLSGGNSKVDENQDTEKNAGSGPHPRSYICALIFFTISSKEDVVQMV